MKKLHWSGVVAAIVVAAPLAIGCSSSDTTTPMNTAGTGSTGGTGGSGSTPTMPTQLMAPASYTILSGADAMPGAAAPAAWTSGTCVACHGANGEGSSGIGPELRHTPASYAQYIVRHGRAGSGMVAFDTGTISDADLTAVIAWLGSLPKPTTGQGLYKDFCGNCHGPSVASGGAVPINIVGAMKTEVTQKVRMGEGTDVSMRNLYMPPHTTTELTDAELGLIMDFIMAK